MKKLYTNIAVVLMAVLTMTAFTSCDKDVDLAYDLDGIWQGTILGNYYYDRYGTNYTDYDTEICFYQNGAFSRGGTGYEIDRDNTTGRYSRFNFDWKVRNGRIYISYDDGTDVAITHYSLWSNEFRGEFRDYHNGRTLATFRFYRINSWRTGYYYDRW